MTTSFSYPTSMALDSNGDPINGAKLYVFEPGTALIT